MIYATRNLLLLSIILLPFASAGQIICTDESRQRLDSVLQMMEDHHFSEKPINQVLIEVGEWFVGTSYAEKTLEVPGDEPLVINLLGLDCTTYLETVITLTRLAKMDKISAIEYERQLEYLRYRKGTRNHYPSRLHYFSDWIYENQKKGILTDITSSIGGVTYENHPSFMSENPKFYPQLSNPSYLEEIKKTEKDIKTRSYHFIPKESVASIEKSIRTGDLIAITIDMDNLDISHVGLAVTRQGRIYLMHASSKKNKVVISDTSLSDYLMGNDKQSGIVVCRLRDPGK